MSMHLKSIVDEYPGEYVTVPDFTPEELKKVIKKSPNRKKWGYDGARFEDYKKDIPTVKAEVSNVLNVVKHFRKSRRA